jgi:hypothetical protein
MLEKGLYIGNVTDVFASVAGVISISDFDVRKRVFQCLEQWTVDGILSDFNKLLSHTQLVTTLSAGVDKIYNDFDFESSYYALSFAEQVAKNCADPVVRIQFMLDTHLYNIIKDSVSNSSTPRNQKLACDIADLLLQNYPSQYNELMKSLEQDLAPNSDALIEHLDKPKDTDIIDFLSFDTENYDCY